MRAKTTGTITLDASTGNAALDTALPTSRLRGVIVTLGTATSVPFALTNMGRTVVAETVTTTKFIPIGELLAAADGSASTSYGRGGAIVHGDVTFTVTGGTHSGTLTVTYIYS